MATTVTSGGRVMMRFWRMTWAPFGLMLRTLAWVMLWPLGLILSWRKGRNRRHRQLVDAMASRQRGVYVASQPPTYLQPPGPLPPPPPPPPG